MPASSQGGPETQGTLGGKISSSRPGDRILIYTYSAKLWWVQPTMASPFTPVQPDGTWSAHVHLGRRYSAILVRGNYKPEPTRADLPSSRLFAAQAIVDGVGPPPAEPKEEKTIHFSGYDWRVREGMGDTGGTMHFYSDDNVSTDSNGAMHLRVTRQDKNWYCAEAHTLRTLGYGTYHFEIREAGDLDPAAMLSLNTWSSETGSHHELDIHISRWGNAESKDGEFVVQPYYVPSNVYRFEVPSGPVTASFRWLPGSAEFAATQRSARTPFASWNFTANVPSSEDEKTYISLCEYSYGRTGLRHETEVVIDRFQFFP